MSADYTTVKVLGPDPRQWPYRAACLECDWRGSDFRSEEAATGSGEYHVGVSGHRVAVQKLTEAPNG